MIYKIKITDIAEETLFVDASDEKHARWLAQGEFKRRMSKGKYDGRAEVVKTKRKIEVLETEQ
tara:strand:- start:3148 stop:3336 length:189 start_codon:yes stop_codon:yes gene_type:complete